MSGIGGGQLLVDDGRRRAAEAGQVRRDVEDAAHVEPLQRRGVAGVASVAQVQERQDLRRRVRVEVGLQRSKSEQRRFSSGCD